MSPTYTTHRKLPLLSKNPFTTADVFLTNSSKSGKDNRTQLVNVRGFLHLTSYMDLVAQYFPDVDVEHLKVLKELSELVVRWNAKVNLISRKDIDNFVLHHLVHSLVLIKFVRFKTGSSIFDLGTGGGLPGLPLAIVRPDVHFTLVDARAKKIRAVQNMIDELNLKNVQALHGRAEDFKGAHDFVVTRAVASLNELACWSRNLISDHHNHALPNGILALKGGNLTAEKRQLPRGTYSEETPISEFIAHPYFSEKFVVYVQR